MAEYIIIYDQTSAYIIDDPARNPLHEQVRRSHWQSAWTNKP